MMRAVAAILALSGLPLVPAFHDHDFGATPVVVDSQTLGHISGTSGTVQGVPYEAFLGIRYAQPPVGKRRFQRPVRAPPTTNISAKAYGFRCPQPKLLPMPIPDVAENEDCLNLNLFRRQGTHQGSDKAVVVVIHGGGFSVGSSADAMYNGAPLAALGDVVTVTFNYRLGVLGFADIPSVVRGNAGLWDQMMAFEWVRDNIREFGGDPNRVTLLGGSAGSMSISAHLMSPVNQGQRLFHGAVMDAGVFAPSLFARSIDTHQRLRVLAKRAGCAHTDHADQLLKCLQSTSVRKLVELSVDVENFSPILTYYPSADGHFIPTNVDDPTQFSPRDFIRVPLIIGYSHDEGSLFAGYYFDPSKGLPDLDTNASIALWLAKFTNAYKYRLSLDKGDVLTNVFNTYGFAESQGRANFAHLMRFLTDGSFACPTNAFVRGYSPYNTHTYGYFFTRLLKGVYMGLDPKVLGAFHMGPYLHFTGVALANNVAPAVQLEDRKYFLDAIKMIVNFAKNSRQAPAFRGVSWPDSPKRTAFLQFKDGRPSIMQTLPFTQTCKSVFRYYDYHQGLSKPEL